MLPEDGNGSQDLQRGRVTAAGHYYIGLSILVVAGPLPDANSFRAVNNSGVHGQPLGQGMLSCDDHVDVIPATQAVIENRQQAVGIRWKVNAHDISLLVDDVVEKSRILVREAVVILLPDVGSEQIVQRRDLSAPG